MKGDNCKTPNDHDMVIDDFNQIICKNCHRVWMEITPNPKLEENSESLLG